MNLFETASNIQKEHDNKARKGCSQSLASTITIPYFKGLYRKGDKYNVTLAPVVTEEKGVIIDAREQHIAVKPLTGAFLISYFTCLAYSICKTNTTKKGNKTVLAPMPCTTYVVQALLQIEGFTLDDYAQGKTTGAKRIELHLKAMTEQRGMALTVDAKTGEISGLTDEIVNSVLTSI